MAKTLAQISKLPLGQRGHFYVAPTTDGQYMVTMLDNAINPTKCGLKKLRALKCVVMYWNPQSGTHRIRHTDDIG